MCTHVPVPVHTFSSSRSTFPLRAQSLDFHNSGQLPCTYGRASTKDDSAGLAGPAAPPGASQRAVRMDAARRLLGVAEGVSRGCVEAAFRRLSMTCHPDKAPAHLSADERAASALKWKQLCDAKSVLLQAAAPFTRRERRAVHARHSPRDDAVENKPTRGDHAPLSASRSGSARAKRAAAKGRASMAALPAPEGVAATMPGRRARRTANARRWVFWASRSHRSARPLRFERLPNSVESFAFGPGRPSCQGWSWS